MERLEHVNLGVCGGGQVLYGGGKDLLLTRKNKKLQLLAVCITALSVAVMY